MLMDYEKEEILKIFGDLDKELQKLRDQDISFCVFINMDNDNYATIGNTNNNEILLLATTFRKHIEFLLEKKKCGKPNCMGCKIINEMALSRLEGKTKEDYPVKDKIMEFLKDKLGELKSDGDNTM